MSRPEGASRKSVCVLFRVVHEFFLLLNLNGNALAAGSCCRLHNGADSSCDFAVVTDDHTGVLISNGQNEGNVIVFFALLDVYTFRMVYDCASDIV